MTTTTTTTFLVGYVVVVTNPAVPTEWKSFAAFVITLIKVELTTVVISKASSSVFQGVGGTQRRRFHQRIAGAVVLFAIGFIVAPIGTVAMVDPRCFYYDLYPPDATTTSVGTTYCAGTTTTNGKTTCTEYATGFVDSTYPYNHSYSGEQCVSAVLEAYGPVHFASLLLASMGTAAAELLVPGLYRWAVSYDVPEYRCGGLARRFLEMAFAVPTLNGEWHPPQGEGMTNQAQYLIERAFRNLICILLVALTFGLAVPLVAVAAAVSAVCVGVHHAFLLGKLADQFPQGEAGPQLSSCCDAPKRVGVFVPALTMSVWMFASYDQFDTKGYAAVAIGCGTVLGGALAMVGLKRCAAAMATPRLTSQQRTGLYEKLISDSEQDMIMARHTNGMAARFAAERRAAAAAEEEKEEERRGRKGAGEGGG